MARRQALGLLDKVVDKSRQTTTKWAEEREAEKKVVKARRKDKHKRKLQDIQNLKVTPTEGINSEGKRIRVDAVAGRLMVEHKRNPREWTREMIAAGQRFEKEFNAANFDGLSCVGFDPRVDGAGEAKPPTAVVAQSGLVDLEGVIGGEAFAALVLFIGYGMTITEMSKSGCGQKRVVGERVRNALQSAAGFYNKSNNLPKSTFMKAAQKIIDGMKNSL